MFNSFRSSSSSNYRQQQQQHLQHQSRQSRHLVNSQMSQQRQIEDLEQKVDMILVHNNKLIQENNQLRQLIENRMSKNSSVQIRELQAALKQLTQEIEMKDAETDRLRVALRQQIDMLTKQLLSSKSSKKLLQAEHKQLKQTMQSLQIQLEQEHQQRCIQLRNQLYQNALLKETEYQQQLSQIKKLHHKQLSQLQNQCKFQQQKQQQATMNKLCAMKQKIEEEARINRKNMDVEFQRRHKQMDRNCNEKIRSVRESTQKYIKSVIDGAANDNTEAEDEYKKEIQMLRQSLKSRQMLIEGLLSSNKSNNDGDSDRYYRESQELRLRIKQITEHFFRESQLLKVKMAIKHQADVKQVAKAYESRLDILGQRLNYVEHQNQRLRKNYEQQIRGKMNLRHKFQIEASKMKNVIRKMKVELQSYGKQLRLNIDGMRDQANSFSMSIIGQLGQQKTKKAFYQQQIRKLQQIIQLKQSQIETTINQSKQKTHYFSQKYESMKNKYQQSEQIHEQSKQLFIRDMQQQKQRDHNEIQKQRQHFEKLLDDIQSQLSSQKQNNDELLEKLMELKADKSVLEKQVQQKQHELESIKAHLQTMRLQMQMMGEAGRSEQAMAPLKKHYERIIENIEKDKQNLKIINSAQADQIGRLVAKYKTLQNSMQKTILSINKRKELDERVMNLGMDNNLVKNLAEIFKKHEQ